MKFFATLREKIVSPLSSLLKQGLSPTKLSLVITLGVVLSIFPVLGTTTLICSLVVLLFQLNITAIQTANYAAFPLQIVLFFPFLKLGEDLSGISLDPISKDQLISTFFQQGFFQAISELIWYLLVACLGWSVASLPMFIILFLFLLIIIKKYKATFFSNELSL
jgi:hypothetical protein